MGDQTQPESQFPSLSPEGHLSGHRSTSTSLIRMSRVGIGALGVTAPVRPARQTTWQTRPSRNISLTSASANFALNRSIARPSGGASPGLGDPAVIQDMIRASKRLRVFQNKSSEPSLWLALRFIGSVNKCTLMWLSNLVTKRFWEETHPHSEI